MSDVIADRQEILFLYEARDCNPNGDPLDENRPRTDPETGEATVTDVRIKRTVRDYLYREKELEILVRDTFEADGTLRDGKGRADDFIAKAAIDDKAALPEIIEKTTRVILEQCVDARLFGATLPLQKKKKKGSIKLTGPVQFAAFNRSMHAVNPVFVQQTAAYASKKGSAQKSFAERWLVPYALIAVYGVINEVAARDTRLTDSDVHLLLKGLWHGTNGLNTHSKMGHQSLLLLRISYRPGFRIGALPERVRLQSHRQDTAIRSTGDYRVDVAPLLDALRGAGERVQSIDVIQDSRLALAAGDDQASFTDLARQVGLETRMLEL